MESYSSSSSSPPLYFSPETNQELYGHRSSRLYTTSLLRSVRKAPAKPWKKPAAAAAPVPTRVYKVDRMNFREVVQQLTGAPDQSRRLRRVAPPPLDIMTPSCRETSLVAETQDSAKPWTPGSLELSLSPNSYMWCSLPLLSPGTLSILEPETVL